MHLSYSQPAPGDIRVGIAYLSLDRTWLDADQGLCELLNASRDSILARSFDELFKLDNVINEQEQWGKLLRGELRHYSSRRTANCEDGKRFPVRIEFNLTDGEESQRPQSILAVVVDLSCLQSAEAALQESETARHELSHRLTTAQEKERTRIARELHDDIGQSLAILRIQMLRAGQPVSGMIGKRHPTIPQLCETLKLLAEKVSRLSHQLHSSELEYLGLAVAVQSHCREFAEKYKILVECSCSGIPDNIDGLLALSLLRIVQEALYNAGKYSKAKSIQVAIEGSATELSLLISDDGVGFDLEDAKFAAGLGLISMRERVHLAGGEFKIVSEPGEGTCIMARVPLRTAENQLAPAEQR